MGWRSFQDQLLLFDGKHSSNRSLAEFVEVLHHRSGIFRYVFPLNGEIQDALQTFQLSIYRCSFDRPFLVEFCWLPPTLIAILLDHFDGYSVQLSLPEECFQLFEIVAMTSNGVLGEASEMGPLELRTQVLEPSPLPWPTGREQSKHDLALAFLPYLGSEFLAGCLGRFAILLTVHRVTHPPESSCFSFVQAQWRSYHLPELGADPIIALSCRERRAGRT